MSNKQQQATSQVTAEPVKFRVVIKPNGEVFLYSDSGDFAAGVEQMEKIIAVLAASGIGIDDPGMPEQHNHDREPQHVLSSAHAVSHAYQ